MKMSDFVFFTMPLDDWVMKTFFDMQDKYVLSDEYRISAEDLEVALGEIHASLLAIEWISVFYENRQHEI